MPKDIVRGYRIYIGGRDYSGDANRVSLTNEADEMDITTVGDTDKQFRAGLRKAGMEAEVFTAHGAGNVDDAVNAAFAAGGRVCAVYPTSTAGETGHSFQSEMLSMSPAMTIGDMARTRIRASQSGGMMVRVTSMDGRAVRTVSGTGTVRQLGAVPSGQSLHSFLHVLSASGTSPQLTVIIRTDDVVGFSTPTTVITHTTFSAMGAEARTLAGPITDTFYRVD